jgi:Flp pilus assembly protein TadG
MAHLKTFNSSITDNAMSFSSSRFHRLHSHWTAQRRAATACGSRLAGEETGQALVEFALVATMLIVLVVGIMKFGLALNTANDETHLANEVARFAAVNMDPGGGGQTLAAWAKSQTDTSYTPTVCISFPSNGSTGTSGQVGDPVQVTVSDVYSWLPILKLGANTTITGKAVMRLEALPTAFSAGCS